MIIQIKKVRRLFPVGGQDGQRQAVARLYSNDGTATIGELSAKQKTIFKLLEIPLPE